MLIEKLIMIAENHKNFASLAALREMIYVRMPKRFFEEANKISTSE